MNLIYLVVILFVPQEKGQEPKVVRTRAHLDKTAFCSDFEGAAEWPYRSAGYVIDLKKGVMVSSAITQQECLVYDEEQDEQYQMNRLAEKAAKETTERLCREGRVPPELIEQECEGVVCDEAHPCHSCWNAWSLERVPCKPRGRSE